MNATVTRHVWHQLLHDYSLIDDSDLTLQHDEVHTQPFLGQMAKKGYPSGHMVAYATLSNRSLAPVSPATCPPGAQKISYSVGVQPLAPQTPPVHRKTWLFFQQSQACTGPIFEPSHGWKQRDPQSSPNWSSMNVVSVIPRP